MFGMAGAAAPSIDEVMAALDDFYDVRRELLGSLDEGDLPDS